MTTHPPTETPVRKSRTTDTTIDKWEREFLEDALVHDILGKLFCDGWTSSLPGIKDTSAKIPMEVAKARLIKAIRPYLSHSLQQARENIHRAYLAQQDNYGAEPEFAEAGWRDLLKQSDLLTKDV